MVVCCQFFSAQRPGTSAWLERVDLFSLHLFLFGLSKSGGGGGGGEMPSSTHRPVTVHFFFTCYITTVPTFSFSNLSSSGHDSVVEHGRGDLPSILATDAPSIPRGLKCACGTPFGERQSIAALKGLGWQVGCARGARSRDSFSSIPIRGWTRDFVERVRGSSKTRRNDPSRVSICPS